MRRSSRYIADPVLAELASGLKNIQFELCPEDREEFFRKEQWFNVAFCKDQTTFRVRMSLGGKLRTIGLTGNGIMAGPTAARFADMARIFFWPFRLRDCREPTKVDMNLSLEAAQYDLNTHTEARELLERIKLHLLDIGAIRLVNAADPSPRARRTARHEITILTEELQKVQLANAHNYEQVKQDNATNYEQIKQAFHHILERLERLEATLKKEA